MHRLRAYAFPDRGLLALFGVYLFIYVFAVPMLIFDLVPAWGTWMGGFLLILQGSILWLWLIGTSGARGAVAGLLIAALAFGVEYVGVTTGRPFGHYSYTPMLGFKLLGAVPLAIPFAWLLVVPSALDIAQRVTRRWQIFVAGLLALGLDFLIEPVAAYVVHYWRWHDSGPYYGVPTANFVAWGTTALLLAGLCVGLTDGKRNPSRVVGRLPGALYVLNLVQFMLVDLAYGYWLAALIGVGLLLVAGLAYGVRRLQSVPHPT